jgi:hypothetical protein
MNINFLLVSKNVTMSQFLLEAKIVTSWRSMVEHCKCERMRALPYCFKEGHYS